MTVSDGNDLVDTALIPFDKLFTTSNGVFVQGIVESIQTNKKGGVVVLADGKQLPYDVLVLAPGSQWEGPLDIPDDSAAVKEFIAAGRANFKKAQKILLVGGGAVGVGELFFLKIPAGAHLPQRICWRNQRRMAGTSKTLTPM